MNGVFEALPVRYSALVMSEKGLYSRQETAYTSDAMSLCHDMLSEVLSMSEVSAAEALGRHSVHLVRRIRVVGRIGKRLIYALRIKRVYRGSSVPIVGRSTLGGIGPVSMLDLGKSVTLETIRRRAVMLLGCIRLVMLVCLVLLEGIVACKGLARA